MLANIIQRSHESAAKEISVSKRKRGPKEAGPPPPKVAKSLSATTIHQALWEGAKLEVVHTEGECALPHRNPRGSGAKAASTAESRRSNGELEDSAHGQPTIERGVSTRRRKIVYPRFGKMAWGMGSVYLRLRKRHPDDKGAHILHAVVHP